MAWPGLATPSSAARDGAASVSVVGRITRPSPGHALAPRLSPRARCNPSVLCGTLLVSSSHVMVVNPLLRVTQVSGPVDGSPTHGGTLIHVEGADICPLRDLRPAPVGSLGGRLPSREEGADRGAPMRCHLSV